jgi:hypothetical protein
MEGFRPSSILNDSSAGQSTLGLKLFSLSSWNTSFHALLAFNFSVEKCAVILMSLLLYDKWSFSLILPLFSMLIVLTIIWHGKDLFCLNRHHFLKIWEIFCYYFLDYITYTIVLYLFSFFDDHDSQVWSLDGVTDFLHINLLLLSLLSENSSFFFL